MRQEVQVYVTIKLKGLGQRFEESDEGDRQMGFGVVHCCYYDKIYLQLIDMGGLVYSENVQIIGCIQSIQVSKY